MQRERPLMPPDASEIGISFEERCDRLKAEAARKSRHDLEADFVRISCRYLAELDSHDPSRTTVKMSASREADLITRAEAGEAEVSRFRDVVEKLRGGLKPFAQAADLFVEGDGLIAFSGTEMTIGDLRTAVRLLAETAPDPAQSREASDG